MHRHKLLWLFRKHWSTAATLLVTGMFTAPSQSAVSPETTRAIFNAGEQRIALSLVNSAERPALVQMWLDDGDIMASPAQSTAPIAVLPPVFRMQPGEIRSVQMVRGNTRALPQDRESLFWLNIYQVPPMRADEQHATQKLVMPLRVRMKLFVRPERIDPPTDQSWQSLQFTRQNSGSGDPLVAITNPTPWFITLSGVRCGQQHDTEVMLAPKSTLSTTISAAACQQIQYQVIDDQGNTRAFTGPVRQAGV